MRPGEFVNWAALVFVAGCVAALVLLTGCSSLAPAKIASNSLNDALVEVAPLLSARCIDPYSPSNLPTEPAERQRAASERLLAYDRSGCPQALRAYDDARRAHLALHAVIGAHEVGECVNVSRSVSRCNLLAAMSDVTKATVAVAERVRDLRAGGL